jgi:hypothetical protein
MSEEKLQPEQKFFRMVQHPGQRAELADFASSRCMVVRPFGSIMGEFQEA